MLIQLPYDYLLLILLLLPVSNQRSLNADHLQRKNKTAEENAKSISLLKVDNFVDGQCPPPTDSSQLDDRSEKCRDECKSDVDCIEDYKCCAERCSFKCIEPWFPNRVVDWTKSPSPNEIYDGLELPNQRNGPWRYGGEPCSTSVLDGLQPFRCPTNHVCQIIMDGDIQLNIPNRGECVRINDKKSASEIMNNENNDDFLTIDAECYDKEGTYKHQEKFRKDCNICVCHNGVVFCDHQPCPYQIGIPASIASYQEQRHPTEYISIDGEEDTEDASGSSGFGYSGDDPKTRVTYEEIEQGANTEGHKKEKSENDENTQEADFSSGDSDEEHLGKVSGRDNIDNESSGYDVIDLIDNGDYEQFSGESGSAELETKDPTTTEPDITTKKSESKITTSARETSTLSPEITTFTGETPPLKSSTLLPEISTESPEAEQYKTTESSKPVKITTTDDVIMLEKGVYEPSGISLGENSGDGKEETEENSGESSSDIFYSGEKQHPSPVYPDTITLVKPIRNQNLSIEANQESEFGFETDDAETDVVPEEVRTGNDGSASGRIVSNDDARNTKQNSETLEYLKTTDDEN